MIEVIHHSEDVKYTGEEFNIDINIDYSGDDIKKVLQASKDLLMEMGQGLDEESADYECEAIFDFIKGNQKEYTYQMEDGSDDKFFDKDYGLIYQNQFLIVKKVNDEA